MRSVLNLLTILSLVAFMGLGEVRAQWDYSATIEVQELQGTSYDSIPVLLTINTADLVTNGIIADAVNGSDLYFAADCAGNEPLSYFVEASTMNTTATKVWVELKNVFPFTTHTIYMLIGPQACCLSSETATLGVRTNIANSTTVIGSSTHNYLRITNSTISNQFPGTVLTLNAHKITLDATSLFDLSAQGANGGIASADGGGSGGGGGTLGPDGAGGAGYGNAGGDGGFVGTQYFGGPAYGSVAGLGALVGSGGGGGPAVAGGDGGGAIVLNAQYIEILGDVNADGEAGADDAANNCGTGGGSGGGILINGGCVILDGSITAIGGDGGSSTLGGAGGGAGGRVKVFYYDELDNTGTITFNGGIAGGGAFPGSAGGDGSSFIDNDVSLAPFSALMSPVVAIDTVLVSGADTACINAVETYTASVVANHSYLWSVSGGTINSGQNTNTLDVEWTTAGNNTVTLVATSTLLGCSDTTVMDVFVSSVVPSPSYTSAGFCTGGVTQFTDNSSIASGSIVSWDWDFGDGNTSSTQDPTHTYVAAGSYDVTLTVVSGFGCSNSFTRTVVIEDDPVAGFTATTECLGDPTSFTNTSTGATTYTWDFGDGNTSALADPTNNYAAPGTYTVTLTATSGVGCTDLFVASVTVNPLPVADYSFVSACPAEAVQFNDNSFVSSGSILSWDWNFDDGNFGVGANPANTYVAEGTYNVELTVTTNNGCTDVITKAVEVYAAPTADFSASAVCEGTATQFNNSSSVASGALTYTWDFGDGSAPSNVTDPAHTYAAFGTYNVQLTATTLNGCTDNTIIAVDVYEQPVAAFTVSNECDEDSVSFTNSSRGAGATFTWDFGDGNTSTDANPTHLYANEDTYTVMLAANTANCTDTVWQTVTIYPKPQASFSAAAVCEGVATDFVNSSSISTGALNYAWDFGDGNNSTASNPAHTYTGPTAPNSDTTYDAQLVAISDKGCTDTAVVSVTINLQPVADFTVDPVCFGDSTHVIDNSTNLDAGAFYSIDFFNDGTIDVPNVRPGDSTVLIQLFGELPAKLIMTNGNGCQDSISGDVIVYPVADAGFTSAGEVCVGSELDFVNTTTAADPNIMGTLSYEWDFGVRGTSTDINPSYVYDTAYGPSVYLTVTTDDGCVSVDSADILVWPTPEASFSYGVACFERPVTFSNLSNNAFGDSIWIWNFGDDSSLVTDVKTDTFHQYNAEGVFQVTLTAVNEYGCVDDTTHELIVYPQPTANFLADDECEDIGVPFYNVSSIASGDLEYNWDFGDVSPPSILEEPVHIFSDGGDYDVKLNVTSEYGCFDSIVRTITIYDAPNSIFSVNPVCFGDTSIFSNNSTPPTGVTYYWDLGDGTITLNPNPTHEYGVDGVYQVLLILTSAEGCVDTAVGAAVVNELPTVEIAAFAQNLPNQFSNTMFCRGDSSLLTAIADDGDAPYSYLWSPAGETDQSIMVSEGGDYCVEVTDLNSCQADTCTSITVWELPVVDAGEDTTIPLGYSTQLHAEPDAAINYDWDPTTGLDDPFIQEPLATPLVTTVYTVTVTDTNTCVASDSVTITVVDQFLLLIPNLITPNGDGFNDTWEITNILNYPGAEILIFDRWGTEVYSATAYMDDWDGTFDGSELPEGSYYYVITLPGADFEPYRGSVNILR